MGQHSANSKTETLIAMMTTLKTVWGFVLRAIEKHTPLRLRSNGVADIFNYRKISETISTSGQPTEQQFKFIRDEGFRTVINLAPTSVLENSMKDEAALLAALDLEYIHIPVDFAKPTDSDFQRFVEAMRQRPKQKVWVHCAANMRVSAFIFRYRRSELGMTEPEARPDLEAIWRPFGVWKRFITAAGNAASRPATGDQP